MRRPALVFVLEQTLGHVAHSNNIRRTLAGLDEIDADVILVPYAPPTAWHRRSGLGNWTLRAGLMARSAIQARLRKGPIDGLFIHTQVSSLLSVELMRRIPTVVSLDATPANFDLLGAAYEHRRHGPLTEGAKAWVNRRSFKAAARLVPWCSWVAESLVTDYEVPAEKIQVIHPGVDLRLFSPAGVGKGDRVRVLFVGGDFERKGGIELVAAVEALGESAELDVVSGSAPDGLGPRVRVHRGLQPQSPELVDLYRKADIFALPSRGDCFPQVIAEGLACGLPVIATDVGGVTEMVKHGVNGFLVPPRAPAQLTVALSRLATDPALRVRMGGPSLELAHREHDADANNRKIVDLMCSLAGYDGTSEAPDRATVFAGSLE